MQTIDLSADDLTAALLRLSEHETVCILDSCGAGHLGSHLLIAGITPVDILEISSKNAEDTLNLLDEKMSGELACIFTISYDFGLKMLGIQPLLKEHPSIAEPDVFIARFDCLIVHDYDDGTTVVGGNPAKFDSVSDKLVSEISNIKSEIPNLKSDILPLPTPITSNFTKKSYLAAIETIKELIRGGDTYQTNLTHQLTAPLPEGLTPALIFERLRREHPAPFASYIKRLDSTVVSASPERFFSVDRASSPTVRDGSDHRKITTSPIKGTRPRGQTQTEDDELRRELLKSSKDRAENTMIVDLLRNDLGRVCEYGSVNVEQLCDLEEHTTLFHLVSTVSGELRQGVTFSEILQAIFPCGSITGAPKISTMRIIDKIETTKRGLSMGAIGYYAPADSATWDFELGTWNYTFDMSVAIRTMVIRDQTATFSVGGGIVIDSDPESEYEETITKAQAILSAINADKLSL